MKKKILLILGIISFVVLFGYLLSGSGAFDAAESLTYDLRAKLAVDKGPFNKKFKHADSNIVIIAIDDPSMRKISRNPQLGLGSFQRQRGTWADLVEFIEKGKPKAILFDLVFPSVSDTPEHDRKFSKTLKKYDNVVLATTLNDPINVTNPADVVASNFSPTAKSLDVEILDKDLDTEGMSFYSHDAIPDVYTKHNTMGVINIVRGESVIRKNQPIFKLIKDDKVYYMPSLSFAGFLKYMGEGGKITIKDGKILYKGREIPIDNQGQTYTSWHGKGYDYSYKASSFIPIVDVLLSRKNDKYIKSDYFKDKIVLIGKTQAGTDIHSTAVNPIYAGTETQATVIDNFINDTDPNNKQARKILTKLPDWAELVIVIASCLLLTVLSLISKNAFLYVANSFLYIVLYIILCLIAFAEPSIRVWVPMAPPLYYMVITAIILFAYRFQKELAERAKITNAFGKFVSPRVLATLMKSHENLVLKNTKKRITMMFCDVKDFTSLSEKCEPEKLMDNLNELFDVIVNVIFENNGTVDKFIGDCIMAYWGDPIASDDDAFMAVKAALEIKKKVNDLKIENARENKVVFDVKIGINTGEALLGLAGSEKIMSYTAMGDAVNTASRLESACSKLKHDILISKATYDDAKSKIVAIDAGKIKVKGKDEQISVFEPVGFVDGAEKIDKNVG